MARPSTSSFYVNPSAHSWVTTSVPDPNVEALHQTLPEFAETPLVPLPDLARELRVGHVLVKDESHRFGLPAFKILGASWAVYRAVAERTGSPLGTSLENLGKIANKHGIRLVGCSAGNWGRAYARMAKYLAIPATVFAPWTMDQGTQDRIASEGAKVVQIEGDYDAAIKLAMEEAEANNSLLVMDTSWPGYVWFPKWVVDGYSTMFNEVDRQVLNVTGGKHVTCAIASVGVGSLAQAVVAHYKGYTSRASVVTVEPKAASCLMTSLEAGGIVPIETGKTIMDGMNAGTVSLIAWPLLSQGVDVSVTVSDVETHEDLQHLRTLGINAGPCGAAPLAALRKVLNNEVLDLRLDSVVVLYCTEGARPYEIPNESGSRSSL